MFLMTVGVTRGASGLMGGASSTESADGNKLVSAHLDETYIHFQGNIVFLVTVGVIRGVSGLMSGAYSTEYADGTKVGW